MTDRICLGKLLYVFEVYITSRCGFEKKKNLNTKVCVVEVENLNILLAGKWKTDSDWYGKYFLYIILFLK